MIKRKRLQSWVQYINILMRWAQHYAHYRRFSNFVLGSNFYKYRFLMFNPLTTTSKFFLLQNYLQNVLSATLVTRDFPVVQINNNKIITSRKPIALNMLWGGYSKIDNLSSIWPHTDKTPFFFYTDYTFFIPKSTPNSHNRYLLTLQQLSLTLFLQFEKMLKMFFILLLL